MNQGNVLFQQNLKHMSNLHFTHVKHYYVSLDLEGLEKGLVIDAEWNVIALLLQLSKWGGKRPFQEGKMFPRRHFCWQPFHLKDTFTPSIHSITYYYPSYHPHHKNTNIDCGHLRKYLSKLQNTDTIEVLFSLKTQLPVKQYKIIGKNVWTAPPAHHCTIQAWWKLTIGQATLAAPPQLASA